MESGLEYKALKDVVMAISCSGDTNTLILLAALITGVPHMSERMDDKKDVQRALFGGADLWQLERTQKPRKMHYSAPFEVWQCVIPADYWRSEH